jgi:hypothetical protein
MATYPAFRSSTLRIVPPVESLGAVPESRAEDTPRDAMLNATSLYAPPYDSALAEGFAWNLVKYLAPAFDLSVGESAGGTVMTLKAPATRLGRPPRYVSFAFPDLESAPGMDDASPDGAEQVFLENVTPCVPPGVLYVLRPEDIVHRLPDVLALVAKWDPALFSERGAVNLERLSSAEARSRRVTHACTQALLSYSGEDSASCLLLDTRIPVPDTLVVHRTMRPRPSSAPRHAPADMLADVPSAQPVVRDDPRPRYARSA